MNIVVDKDLQELSCIFDNLENFNLLSLSPEDIKRALMLEVFFMKQRPNMLEQCEEMKKTIQEIIKDEEENGEEVFIDGEEEEDEEEFTESTCQCAMCNCFNTIYTRWENFTPEQPMEIIMAKHISSM